MYKLKLFILIFTLFTSSIVWPDNKFVSQPTDNYTFIVLKVGSSLVETRNWIQSQGGRVTLMVNPNALIAKWEKPNHLVLANNPQIQKAYLNTIPQIEVSAQPELVAALMRFFNDLITGEVQKKLETNLNQKENKESLLGSDALSSPEIDFESYLLNLEKKKVKHSRFMKSVGIGKNITAGELGNSEEMIGTVAVTLFFVESNGSIDPNLYNWMKDSVENVLLHTMYGLYWWSTKAQSYNQSVSFLINYYPPTDLRCQTGYEPVLNDCENGNLWVGPIMSNFGFIYGSYEDKVAAFNSWQIDTFQTDWAYSAFIVYDDWWSDLAIGCEGGRWAYAFMGGPFIHVIFSHFWWNIFAHETGHIFGACDEYRIGGCDSLSCKTICSEFSHNTVNGNCENCNPQSVPCIMRYTLELTLCDFTRGQIGWGIYQTGVPALLLAPSWSDIVADSGSVLNKNLRIRNIGDDTTTLTIFDIQSDKTWLTIAPSDSFPNHVLGQDSLDYTLNFDLRSLPLENYTAHLFVTSNDSGLIGAKDTINISLSIEDIDYKHNWLFDPQVNYRTGQSPLSIFASDLDGDGDWDLVVANAGAHTVSILKNKGDGTFSTKVDYATGYYPSSVFASDLDGDGDQDLVVANRGASSVSILKNNGDGTFAAKVDYGIGSGPSSIFISDLDGDGDFDLAVVNGGSNTVSVLKNNGDGTFAAKVDYGTGSGPSSIFISDLDGDGDFDLAVANYYSNTVSVLKNKGDGTFSTKVDYATGYHSSSVFASDLDGDGDFDLAVANNYYSNTVSVLKNNGDGTFSAKVDYATGKGPHSVFAADLDKDGDMDLVTTRWIAVSTLYNNGDATFAEKLDNAVGHVPNSVFASDLDGDGDIDLAVTSLYDSTVSILRNSLINCYTIPGDANSDSKLDLADIVFLVNFVFRHSYPPSPLCRGDMNADGEAGFIDIFRLVNYIFKGGPAPAKSDVCCL